MPDISKLVLLMNLNSLRNNQINTY